MAKDVDLFAAAMTDVKPLRGRKRPPVTARPKAERSLTPHKRSPAPLATIAPPELALDDQIFDRDISRSLARGKLVPQASLDLHGMTLAAAERAVAGFLDNAVAGNLRVVLIVTGKGLRLNAGRMVGGRIRAEFLGWLNRADNRQRVRAVRPAHPRHGGSGAFYLLLRRPSNSRSAASSRSLRATPQR
jgi:DNA-nicking Smr family endonuclease